MPHKSKQECNNDPYVNEKKTKKKKKKKQSYSLIKEVNYLEEDYLTSTNNKTDSRNKKKIYIGDENKLNDFQEDHLNNFNEKRVNFSSHLSPSNDNKIFQKQHKKEKRKINNNDINESIELNEIICPNGNLDRISNNLYSHEKNKNEINSGYSIENQNTLNNNLDENVNDNPVEDEQICEDSTQNNVNISNESNIFKKIFNKIKRTVIERKGNPITNENIAENEVSELNIINDNRNEQNNNYNEENSMGEDNYMVNGNVDDYNIRENINEQNERTNEIISLNELNPNDVLDNMVLENQENETRNRILNYNDRNNDINNNTDNNSNNFTYRNISNNIISYCKNYMTDIKEKIKKYWLERVQEANTQLNTPHQSSNRPNLNSREDENDDPSCLQILFFLGLICKFPILWIIGSIIFCVTPNEHKRTKKWSLINSVFAFISIIYFILTSKFKGSKPVFFVVMNNNMEDKNIFNKGIIKYNNTINKNSIILDEFSPHFWLSINSKKVYKTSQTSFLNWNFISSQKPNSNILLSGNVHKLLNRVQVTFVFGKGNKCPTGEIEKIKYFLKDLKKNMDPIPYEKIRMTDQDIPDNFFGGGLRCEKVDKHLNEKKDEKEKEKEKWYLFWKEDDDINNALSDFTFNSFIPVGEVFFFKNEYNCRIAFIYPKNLNFDQVDIPHNFVEIKRIIIKSF
ncbi:conserved Plasmodium protein, unknown function [Plasmodium gallinaceum]|uniref:Uncharacterized protein n=1 Tax=Plasmodium gallinaceum TaxID=5849 RepID=A0A1J1GXD5_PLAGA|nr:conserved Plasmodium protein, unknown function [Plasmodium gallinaceum]CRG95957.1 conserved Plasmodium protein, unknown function [Plasmodium gallinaceum]